MENSSFKQIREALEKSKSIGILTPKDPDLDKMAAALALYLSLSLLDKEILIATPSDPLVEVSSLVGIDKVKTSLDGGKGDLVVSFPYQEGSIEKVSYTLENDFLNIIVKAGENGLSFKEEDIRFLRGQGIPELIFVVGAQRITDLGKLFDPGQLKNTTIVNINNQADNQSFGDIHIVSNRFSSISEAVGNIILSLGLKIDSDIAQNLMAGISFATENFQNPNTSSLAFEMAGILMRNGAARAAVSKQTARSQEDITKELQDFFSLKPSQNRQMPRQQMPRPPIPKQQMQRPQMPRQQMPNRNLHKNLNPEEELLKENDRIDENPPEDWLAPKIYKGSTDFDE